MSAPMIDPMRLERNWQAITAEIDAPVPSRAERFVRRLGLSARVTRVALATPSLRRAWFVALGVVLFLGLAAGDTAGRESIFGFLVVAPLIPVLGVSFAYGVEADPAYEIAVATPMRGLRLVLTRAAVTLVVSALVLLSVAVFNSAAGLFALAWLLPSLALTFVTLAVSTWVAPRRAAALTAGGWLVVLLVIRASVDDRLAAFSATGQLVAVAAAMLAFAVVWHRRDRFDLLVAHA
ncbi:MAG: zf-HC2 domain-containing protein [Acidimicrobiales bacterium]|nr:zf-HC2 domain-containing protein [Acidimicrobiales bacterium]